jgi:hypothetical protein
MAIHNRQKCSQCLNPLVQSISTGSRRPHRHSMGQAPVKKTSCSQSPLPLLLCPHLLQLHPMLQPCLSSIPTRRSLLQWVGPSSIVDIVDKLNCMSLDAYIQAPGWGTSTLESCTKIQFSSFCIPPSSTLVYQQAPRYRSLTLC